MASAGPPPPSTKPRASARLHMQHLQAIEDNPPTAEKIAMFEMFEREELFKRRHKYIAALFDGGAFTVMAGTSPAMTRDCCMFRQYR
ncbi:hypothetical protein [Methylocystis sp.]|jgi:hypothetical protein|uniref:hypothetical protein n=1 Tax=Methylocystis sp. TaxID=1911079 RepID=UPI0025E92A1B|nr:hypothetical protein [Methylocystis sp.]